MRLRAVVVWAAAIAFFALMSIIFATRQLPILLAQEVDVGDVGTKCGKFNPQQEPAQPYRYNITIIPDIRSKKFSGEAVISFNTTSEIRSVFVHLGPDVVLHNFRHQYERCNDNEILITFRDRVKGEFDVAFEFSSPLSNDNHGLYGTKEPTSGWEGVATQLEATHARRVFPCYDTPSSKAVFSLSVFAERGTIAVANTPVVEKAPWKNGEIYRFEDTPKMSPYLVAFAVGKWDLVTGKTKRGVAVDVYVPLGQSKSGEFALKFAAGSIDIFEEMFGVNYPLPRLQLAAIPDFAAGAMENWGLVTFRYQALLAIDGVSSLSALNQVAGVVVHENAHMWAGDLVSPDTWNDLWLNEGFATLLPLFCLPKIDERFDGMTDFHRFDIQEAIEFDFSQYTHPIQADMSSTEDVAASFDSITYSKAATVLNMLRLYMGDATFWKSLASYFNKYAYSSATSDDLVRSFEHASGMDISSFTDKWTKESGFPTVHVSRKDGKYALRQRRLMLDGTEVNTTWVLPLVRSDTGETVTMKDSVFEVVSDFTTFNDGRLSMAIIEYDEDLQNELLEKWDKLSPGAKWMLIEDTKLLVISFRKPASALMQVLEKVKGETNEHVIEAAVGAARFMYEINESTKATLCDILSPSLTMKRSANESVITSRLRVKLLTALGLRMNNSPTIEVINSIDIDNCTEDLMTVAILAKGRRDFEYVHNLYLTSVVPQIQVAALSAMGAAELEPDIVRAFEMLDSVKKHEIPTLVASLSVNPHAKSRLVGWMTDNLKKLTEMFGAGYQMQQIMRFVVASISDLDTLENFVNWVSQQHQFCEQTIGREAEYARAKIKLSTK